MEWTFERAIAGIMAITPFLESRAAMIETSASRKMLRVLDGVSGSRAEGLEDSSCGLCSERAEIFQVTGDYCLHCWQEERHPDV
jgi:hypothetical protein